MNGTRLFCILSGTALAACSVPDTNVRIVGVAMTSGDIDDATGIVDKCEFDSADDTEPSGLVLDTAAALMVSLPLKVLNDTVQADIQVQQQPVQINLSPATAIRPLRMDVVWECDSNGFSGDLGPLVLPAFDPVVPFCLDKRADTQNFVGFDVVSASGAAIQGGGGRGIASVGVVPFAMGQAIDETLRIAALAEQCCFETRASNCDGQSNALPCTRLTQIFQALDPTGSNLQVAVQTGPSEDLVRFQAFALFNGANLCARDRTLCDSSFLETPAYKMRLKGVMEFLKADGSLVTSDEYTKDLSFCRNCGYWDGLQKFPAFGNPNMQCYAGNF